MPITTIAKRPPEVGRLRLGEKGVSQSTGKTFPKKLDTWRLTSPSRNAIDAAARMWGGTVKKWEDEWEVITKASELPVRIAPVEPSLYYEMWSAGGCQRRCDGEQARVPDGKGGMAVKPCLCLMENGGDSVNRACKFHMRASFFLEDLPAFGVWRVESGGYYAATEFFPCVEILVAQARNGNYPAAMLAIDKRSRKVQNAKGETETRNYIVPVLRIEQTLRHVWAGIQPGTPAEAIEGQNGHSKALPAVECTCNGPKVGKPHTRSCPAYDEAVDGAALKMEVML